MQFKSLQSQQQNEQMDRVILGEHKAVRASSNTPVVSGVLQGTLRGPLLSLSYIHVHVMPETTTSSETKLFADDSLFTAQSTTRHTTTYYRKT
jgi:hypothetical protein